MAVIMKSKNKLLSGIGINDADYEVQKKVITESGEHKKLICPFYSKWKSMIDRCYKSNSIGKNTTYTNCTVCTEWLTFSNFKSWMEKQDWEGKHLDKDILLKGNRVYCPEFCRMVNPLTNIFICDRAKSRGKYLIGVHLNKKLLKYQSSCRNQFTKKLEHLGLYEKEIDAHLAWKRRKLELAHMVGAYEKCQEIKSALLAMYSQT